MRQEIKRISIKIEKKPFWLENQKLKSIQEIQITIQFKEKSLKNIVYLQSYFSPHAYIRDTCPRAKLPFPRFIIDELLCLQSIFMSINYGTCRNFIAAICHGVARDLIVHHLPVRKQKG